MSRPSQFIPEANAVTMDSLHYLKEIYVDGFITGFILDLMTAYANNIHSEPTEKERTLVGHLQQIELANALAHRFVQANALQQRTDPPPAPKLHLIQQSDVDSEYQKLRSDRGASAKIYRRAVDFDTLYSTAYDILIEYHHSGSKKANPLGKAIYGLMTKPYNAIAMAKHMTQLNQTQATVHTAIKSVKTGYEGALTEVRDELRGVRDDFQQTQQSLLDMSVRYDRLNETFVETQSLMLNTSMMSQQVGTANGGLLNKNRYLIKVKGVIDQKRWACVIRVVRAINEAHPQDQILRPQLLTLLKSLLTHNMSEEEIDEDKTVETWLATYGKIDEVLAKDLAQYQPLMPLNLVSEEKENEYYLSLAHCFSNGAIFPKDRDMAEAFNNLRPKYRRKLSTVDEGVSDRLFEQHKK